MKIFVQFKPHTCEEYIEKSPDIDKQLSKKGIFLFLDDERGKAVCHFLISLAVNPEHLKLRTALRK